jgi:hypothetical protein
VAQFIPANEISAAQRAIELGEREQEVARRVLRRLSDDRPEHREKIVGTKLRLAMAKQVTREAHEWLASIGDRESC